MSRATPPALLVLAVALATGLPPAAHAAAKGRAKAAARQFRPALPAFSPEPTAAAALTPDQEPAFDLTVGLSRDTDDNGGGRETGLPFLLGYTSMQGTRLELGSVGITRTCAPQAGCAQGLADLSLALKQPLPGDLELGLSVSVPTGGGAGSSSASQSAALRWTRDLHDRLNLTMEAGLTRFNAPDAGVSRTSPSLMLDLAWGLAPRWTVHGIAQRSLQRGAQPAGSTDLMAELDFPISAANGRRQLDGVLTLTRGVSGGARHTGLEFDLCWRF